MDQYYYVFGFLLLVYVILGVTCAEITIVLNYFQLCSEGQCACQCICLCLCVYIRVCALMYVSVYVCSVSHLTFKRVLCWDYSLSLMLSLLSLLLLILLLLLYLL
jgi:Endomembrane protein 70